MYVFIYTCVCVYTVFSVCMCMYIMRIPMQYDICQDKEEQKISWEPIVRLLSPTWGGIPFEKTTEKWSQKWNMNSHVPVRQRASEVGGDIEKNSCTSETWKREGDRGSDVDFKIDCQNRTLDKNRME